MDYSIGSLSDLISGSHTPNKRKVFQKEVTTQPVAVKLTPPEKKDVAKKHRIKQRTNLKIKKLKNKIKRDAGDPKAIEGDISTITTDKQVNLYNDRTIFVGNVAISTTKTELKKLFEQFGKIETIRFRSAPLADPRTPKKVAAIKKEFHPDREALHSYVRFAARDDALKAIALNGHTFKNLHLRVNICSETDKPPTMKAIFVGNIPFDAEEEALWNLFEVCGSIESVRLIRDSRTGIGKGFGYVNFTSSDAVHLAVEMDDVKLKNRVLRISKCKMSGARKRKRNELSAADPTIKKRKSKKIKLTDSSQPTEENDNVRRTTGHHQEPFQGKVFADKKKKKKFDKGVRQKKKMIKLIAPK